MTTNVIPEVLPVKELPRLFFNKRFMGAVVSGDMTKTVRLKPIQLSSEGLVTACFSKESFKCNLFIVSAGVKKFKDFNESDAFKCGYNSLKDFRDDMNLIYKDRLTFFTLLYYYDFEVV